MSQPPVAGLWNRLARLALLVSVTATLVAAAAPATMEPEPGERGQLPPATSARLESGIGRLLVPSIRYRNGYPQHYDEQCSATLVAATPQRESRLLLSAWHCVEHYRDLSRNLLFVDRDTQRHPVSIVASGGGMHSDWVLLRLGTALPAPLALARPRDSAPDRMVLAGYPRAGNADGALVVRTACVVTGRDGADLRSDCVLTRGASGGAAITTTGALRYLGVISRGDGASQSVFVPVTRFHAQISGYLAAQEATGR